MILSAEKVRKSDRITALNNSVWIPTSLVGIISRQAEMRYWQQIDKKAFGQKFWESQIENVLIEKKCLIFSTEQPFWEFLFAPGQFGVNISFKPVYKFYCSYAITVMVQSDMPFVTGCCRLSVDIWLRWITQDRDHLKKFHSKNRHWK